MKKIEDFQTEKLNLDLQKNLLAGRRQEGWTETYATNEVDCGSDTEVWVYGCDGYPISGNTIYGDGSVSTIYP